MRSRAAVLGNGVRFRGAHSMTWQRRLAVLAMLGTCLTAHVMAGGDLRPASPRRTVRSVRQCERVVDWEGRYVGDRECEALANASRADCGSVRELTLICTLITDRSMQQLSRLDALERLDLRGTQITDAGLASYAVPGRLELIDLRGTLVTAAGVGALQQRAPRVEILWTPRMAEPLLLAKRGAP